MNEHDRDANERDLEEDYDITAARARQRRVGTTERAEETYTRAYLSAVDLVEEINERLRDLPAPGETFTPDWEDVGSLVEVTRRLKAVVAFLTRNEEEGR